MGMAFSSSICLYIFNYSSSMYGPFIRKVPSTNIYQLCIFKASVFQMSTLQYIHQELSRKMIVLVLCMFLNILKSCIKLPEISRKPLFLNTVY